MAETTVKPVVSTLSTSGSATQQTKAAYSTSWKDPPVKPWVHRPGAIFPLERLPPELRLQVCEHVCGGKRIYIDTCLPGTNHEHPMITDIENEPFKVPEGNVEVIYRQVMNPPPVVNRDAICFNFARAHLPTGLDVGLLLTSKSISREFQEAMYKTNQFVFRTPAGFMLWLEKRSETQIHNLKYIGFHLSLFDYVHYVLGYSCPYANYPYLLIDKLSHGNLLNPKVVHLHYDVGWPICTDGEQLPFHRNDQEIQLIRYMISFVQLYLQTQGANISRIALTIKGWEYVYDENSEDDEEGDENDEGEDIDNEDTNVDTDFESTDSELNEEDPRTPQDFANEFANRHAEVLQEVLAEAVGEIGDFLKGGKEPETSS